MRDSQAEQKSPAGERSQRVLALPGRGGIASINIRNAARYDEFLRMREQKTAQREAFVA